MTDLHLEQILPAARSGEAWALRVVYEELAPRVHGYLVAHGAREPEDLTSEVFLTVLPRLASLTGGVPGLKTFTFSVAHARLVDDHRKRSRREPERPYEPEQDRRTSASAEQVSLEELGTERVHALLDTLPAPQREVLLLRIVADLSVDEVAHTIGKSPGAVKQLQRRGLLHLRETLRREARDELTHA